MERAGSVRGRLAGLVLGLTLGAGLLGLAACGDEEAGGGQGAGESQAPWSVPSGTPAAGSPDGDGVVSAADLLARLRARVATGGGAVDATYERDVAAVAAVLWPTAGEEPIPPAARAHLQVAAIAGEVARWLAEGPAARAERVQSDPTDVGLHDAFLEAAAGGPEAYAAWCRREAPELLQAHMDERYRRLMGPGK